MNEWLLSEREGVWVDESVQEPDIFQTILYYM